MRIAIPVRVPSIGKIDLFKNYLYLIGTCAKQIKKKKSTLKKQLHKKM